ncbi:hypothetical protein Ocin01_12050 [Orchesella cincta]|uniref:Uncharacterized protein n=1 Tax=Orchesella cincta TaxID=48709 RepID=A0A1D2MP46_ORCCI|nr:hypothetical protein Ocin01_12050 [Orchesella cincta]
MNTLSIAVFAAVCAYASAGLLGAQVAYAPAATYSNYGARISQSARPVAYAQVPQVAYQQAIAAPVAVAQPIIRQQVAVAQQIAVPAATYSTFKNRVSQSARPVAYAQVPQVAYAQQAIAAVPQVAYAQQAIASPALSYGSIGYGYNGALAGGLIH